MNRLRPMDVLVPAAVAAVGLMKLLVVRPNGWGNGLALETGATVLLVWRRFATLVVSTAAAAVLLVMPWTGAQLNELATPILFLALICYSLGRWIADLRGWSGSGCCSCSF